MAPCKSGLLPEGLPCINKNIETRNKNIETRNKNIEIVDFFDSSGVVAYTDYPVSGKKFDPLVEVQTIWLLLGQ